MPLAGASRAAGEGFRISSGDQAPREIGRIRQLAASPQSRGDRSCQNVSKKEPGPTLLLGLGKGHETGNLHASGQRLRDRGNQEKIGGAGKDEASRTAIQVDGELDGGQQLRCALDLVDGDLTRECGNKARGIRFGGGQIGRVVKNVTSWKP